MRHDRIKNGGTLFEKVMRVGENLYDASSPGHRAKLLLQKDRKSGRMCATDLTLSGAF